MDIFKHLFSPFTTSYNKDIYNLIFDDQFLPEEADTVASVQESPG